MAKVKTIKRELKWTRNKYGEIAHSFMLNGREIASIFPKETKDGRIHWGFWIDRIEGHREINTDNCKTLEVSDIEITPTCPKRKDMKNKVEELVLSLLVKNEQSV